MISRRGFLGGLAGIIAAGVAPAIVKEPMKIYAPPKKIITPLSGLGADFDGDTMDWLHEPWVTERQQAEFDGLRFGDMAWKPELRLVLPLRRDGSRAKELVVQPAFRHVTQLPILNLPKLSTISPGQVQASRPRDRSLDLEPIFNKPLLNGKVRLI